MISLLAIAPASSIMLVAVLFLLLHTRIPSHVARHLGSGGTGHGSTISMLSVICSIAVVAFTIGGVTAKEFLGDSRWSKTEKSISVGFVSLGYGAIGVAMAILLNSLEHSPDEVAAGPLVIVLLGFLLTFTVALGTYTRALPRARIEPPS